MTYRQANIFFIFVLIWIAWTKPSPANTGSDTAFVGYLLREGQRLHYSNPDSALYYYQLLIDQADIKAQESSQDLNEQDKAYVEIIIKALNNAGNIYYYNDEYTRSEYYYMQSLDLAEAAGLKELEARALFDLGYVRYVNNEYKIAEGFFLKSYYIYAENGNERGMFNALQAGGLNYRRLGEFERSDSCYRESLRLAAGLNDSLSIADVRVNLGILYCEQGNLEEGIGLFEQALAYYESVNNKKAISLALLNIGVVMKMVGEYDKALSYIGRSADIEEFLQQKSQLVVRYYNLADLYLEMGEPDKAYAYCQKILPIAAEIGSQPFMPECNFLLGKYYFMKNRFAEAGDYFNIAAVAASNNFHKPLMANIFLWNAKAKLNAGLFTNAISLAKEAYSIADNTRQLIVRKEAAKVLSEAFEKEGNTKEALIWYKTFLTHSDSLSYFNQLQEISRIEASYNYEKKEKENEILREKSALQGQKLRNRNALSISLIVIVVLSAVIIVLLVKRNRDRKLLFDQQQMINLQHLEEIEGELDGKKRELASKMMFLNQKNELISRLIRRLQEIQQSSDISSEELISVVNELRVDAPQSNWREFETQFTQVHPGFYRRLYEKHPELTSYEQRICAFLRMNLNTKEIASITGRSAKSVEVTRSRIRTKLKLARNDNLSSFLAAI